MNNVLKFPTNYSGEDDTNVFLIGYAAGVCDVWRQTQDCGCVYTLQESGLDLEDFIEAGIEEYDLETLKETWVLAD